MTDKPKKPGKGYTIRNGKIEPSRQPGQRHGGGRQKKPESEKHKVRSIRMSPVAWQRWAGDPEYRKRCLAYIEREAKRKKKHEHF